MELPQRSYRPTQYNITKLVSKLDRNSPVRVWLESNGEFAEGSAATLFEILSRPAPTGWIDQAVAFHLLGCIELSPQERQQAEHLFLAELVLPFNGHRSRRRRIPWGLLTLSVAAPFLAMLYFTQFDVGGLGALLLLASPLFTLWSFSRFASHDRLSIVERAATAALAHVGSPESIVVLYRHFSESSAVSRDEALYALRSVLPRVTAEWYGRMPLGSTVSLTSLAALYETDVALAALNALYLAGDGSSVKTVQHIAAHSPAAEVRARAAAILPTLIARQRQEEAASMLLRPSARDLKEHLVRPVYEGTPDVTNLLRASHPQSSETPTDNLDR